MSVLVMSMVYATKLGGATRKAVALKLADYANDEGGNIWPSVETIAKQTEVCGRTVQRTLKAFVKERLLIVTKAGGNGPKSTTHYRFDLTKLAPLAGPNKGDTVSPTPPAKGDTQSQKGCHHVTQSIKEPSKRSFERVSDDRRKRPAAVHRFVSEDALDRVRVVAPGWDRQALLRKFSDWPGSRNANNLDQAFIGWAKSFTKGRAAA